MGNTFSLGYVTLVLISWDIYTQQSRVGVNGAKNKKRFCGKKCIVNEKDQTNAIFFN